MENNTITRKKRKRIWPIEIIAGLFIMMIVFFIAVNVDIKTTQETLSDTAHYINEQCNSFTRLNLASETKSLLRVIESAQQIKHNITYERSLSDKDIFTEEFIKKNMQECYLTAVIIMDSKGNLIAQEYTDEYGADELNEYLDSTSLIDVVDNTEKTYAIRIDCEDGSYVDLAACGMADSSGIVVVYYHTPAEYVNNYNLSFTHILSGYDDREDGKIVVTKGNQIIASNDDSMLVKILINIMLLRR